MSESDWGGKKKDWRSPEWDKNQRKHGDWRQGGDPLRHEDWRHHGRWKHHGEWNSKKYKKKG